ncbi:UNVERIFIED_CONTAM: hypothetical protein RMT77_003065 [Armadillidium vulgare]
MELYAKSFTLTLMILNFINISHLQTTPQDRCSQEGDQVCLDCFTSGTCVDNGDGTYSFENIVKCPSSPTKAYCDDTLFSSGNYGQCAPLSPTATRCGCSSIINCVVDPNNPRTILHCESDPPVSDPPCSVPAVDLTTCSCLSCSDSCPFVDDPNDNCGSYFYCYGGDLVPYSCPSGFCFNQELCVCSSSPTNEPTLTTFISTESSLPCPPGCDYLDDPSDDCQGFFICYQGQLVPSKCPGVLCFNQEKCLCM